MWNWLLKKYFSIALNGCCLQIAEYATTAGLNVGLCYQKGPCLHDFLVAVPCYMC